MTYAIGLSLGVGVAILGLWIVLVVRRQVPELQDEVPSIRFHIAAEVGMALLLLAGGVALIVDAAWGVPLTAAALGAALYSTVNSPGYYADRRLWPPVVMFLVLALLIGAALAVLLASA